MFGTPFVNVFTLYMILLEPLMTLFRIHPAGLPLYLV